ncbi:toll/interleukin-1 receptor domain-containing protein [Paraburkholderia sabiae]|uniref:Toll/interleukin-1 receptor domain-containing protein n=1 Tax=Paraburkholderia sabiae TaxID=273251 RepID=A0ABU9QC02_9BURK|nr:toll/interleukin-1 receptor domain-containing protein [Paraburkholderia sabiae]WJZ75782.1 toll/interleukin-1 receptor domain-containing protein [Paraburkholderia sabiae]CAD6561487.1 hypothetical protein LMG24235_07325 [Paraburkholderia sabiae]
MQNEIREIYLNCCADNPTDQVDLLMRERTVDAAFKGFAGRCTSLLERTYVWLVSLESARSVVYFFKVTTGIQRESHMSRRVFYSYSHVDAELRANLASHLATLVQQGKIEEWHDRKITPGKDWDQEISDALESADIILLLVSADFLASEYSFGVEVDRALALVKEKDIHVIPVLLRPCLWEESRFSALQPLPRNQQPVTSWPSRDDAFKEIAREIGNLASQPRPQRTPVNTAAVRADQTAQSLELIREQIYAYARLYEMTRQRMSASAERTARMEQIFQSMKSIAVSCYPMLSELSSSRAPGERLAAIAILQTFATAQALPFLVKMIGSEKPFVGYQAAKALKLAVERLDPRVHPQLLQSILDAQAADAIAMLGHDTDRVKLLREAERELRAHMKALSTPGEG